MTDDNETHAVIFKALVIWAGTVFGGLTLSSLVLSATLVYTTLQIIILIRKMWKGQA